MNKLLTIVSFVGLIVVASGWLPAEEKVDYIKQIKPILSLKCYSCHGALEQEGELRVDTGNFIRKGGDSGAAVSSGKAAESLLIERITSNDEADRMPPEGKPLSKEQVTLLKRWIDQGAQSPANETPQNDPRKHWAFKAPMQPVIPKVKNVKWVRNPIDAFVLARLEKEGIKPSPSAKRSTLIRRLSLDLTGLPPTPEQINAFLKDERPDAYARLVDRLLASTAFGERWGRHWLDLARYADSNGYEDDRGRPDAFRFRDWVVNAYNNDMPFDKFTIAQLAGDLLPKSSYEQKLATGFHRMTLSNEGGADSIEEEFRVIAVKDRVDTTGSVWLGLSVGCAKCHSHKYDPISQTEYYQLFAFFNNAEETSIPAPPIAKRYTTEYKKKITEHRSRLITEKQKVVEYETNVLPPKLAKWKASAAAEKNLKKRIKEILSVPATKRGVKEQFELVGYLGPIDPGYAVSIGSFLANAGNNAPLAPSKHAIIFTTKNRKSHLHIRGNFLAKGNAVQPGTPHFLPPIQPRGKMGDRLDLARWIVDPKNPLTARVAVNHMWRHLFGRGLVATPDQFGMTGTLPSHPKLIDWLATEFVKKNWSRKAMIRLIVTSSTYRQSSLHRKEIEQRDPDNILLARQARLRLEAECVRDVALSVSGLLNRQLGGPGFQPPLPTSLLNAEELMSERLMMPSEGPDRYRRGLYVNVQRMFLLPMLQTFDVADPNGTCARRERSNTPLQALTLLNGPVYSEVAVALGKRITKECKGDISEKIRFAYRLCLGRMPDDHEIKTLKKIMPKQNPGSEFAASITLARTLINLDEFITRE